MGRVIRGPWRHARASSRRAARFVSKSAETLAARAFSVAKIDAHHSDGIQSRCHHLVTMPADAPISEASAIRAPGALMGPQSSMTERNDVTCDIPGDLGQSVLKRKTFLSLDGGIALGHTVPMAAKNLKAQLDQAFISRVIKAREASGMTQQEVADGMGIPQDHYKHWEKSRAMPHYLIPRFCIVVRVEDGWLISNRGPMKRQETKKVTAA
jgi:hypothetical protein